MNRMRVLAIPVGLETDAEGRKVGDDWLVADFGTTEVDNKSVHIYVTTDRVRATALRGSALTDAEFFVDMVNQHGGKAL